jgi:phosphomannomutase
MTQPHPFHPSIIRHYDVRGIVGETLTERDAFVLGRALGAWLRRRQPERGLRACVGRDGRQSSAAMERALVDGLSQSGVAVARIGLGPTPMLYFAGHELGADVSVMVTGSHNPSEYNGFKIMLGKGPFYGGQLQQLAQIAAAGEFVDGAGDVEEVEVKARYVARLLQDFPADATRLRIAWDAGNGAVGAMLAELVAQLPGQHFVLYDEVDGRFPNHHPDPTVEENLRDLRKLVLREGCDLGIGFDGDGDRIGIIDNRGTFLYGDQILMLLAEGVLAAQPGAKIIADVKASQVLFDEIARLGGQPIMAPTGHANIKARMIESGALLAGEMSGHIFFADRYYGFDDAIYAALRLLLIYLHAGQDLATYMSRFPTVVATPEVRIACAEERKFDVVAEMKQHLRNSGAQVNDLDGVRVQTPHGWWLLRASNTQPVLSLRAEARDSAALAQLLGEMRGYLKLCGVDFPDDLPAVA